MPSAGLEKLPAGVVVVGNCAGATVAEQGVGGPQRSQGAIDAFQAVGETQRLCRVIETVKRVTLGMAAQVCDAGDEEIGVSGIGIQQSAQQCLHRQKADGPQCLLAVSESRQNAQRSAQGLGQRVDDFHAFSG